MMDAPDVVSNEEKETSPQQLQLNVGMALREARERLGMSVNDIADRIKFAPRQVEALESNDFAHLPQSTFLRGFVRSYARVLQLDEAALLAALPVEAAPQAAARAPMLDVSFPGMRSLRGVNVLWLAGALAVALVSAVLVLLYDGAPEPALAPTEIVVESVPLPGTDVPASAVAAEAPQEMDKVAAEAKHDEPATPSQPVAAIEAQVVAASAPAAVKPPVPLEQLKRRPLHFVFSETAWAEVIDVNGAILLSKTNLAGSEQWIGGPRRAPYDITIAHPDNVKLYYKGKEIDLSSYAGMDIARLKVE